MKLSIAELIRHKMKMEKGGMVEGDDEADDFLTADMGEVDLNEKSYPDADGTEHESSPKSESEDERLMRRMKKIFGG